MSWRRCLRLYSPGIVVVVLSLLLPFTGNSAVVLAARGLLIGLSLIVATRENVAMVRERRERRNGREGRRRASE